MKAPEPEALNEAEDMNADFLKTKAEKESELQSELEEKKPTDLSKLDFKARIGKGDKKELKSKLKMPNNIGEGK